MESNIERFHVSFNDLKAKNEHLQDKQILLEMEIQKQMYSHRNYVEHVAATRTIHTEEHNKEKEALLDDRRKLIAVNLQFIKDVEFYKDAYEQLAKRKSSAPKPPTASKRRPPKQIQNRWTTEMAHMNLSLFEQNKRLQHKLSDVCSKNKLLNQKVEQLEHFRNQIENKKSNNVCGDSEQLDGLVDPEKDEQLGGK